KEWWIDAASMADAAIVLGGGCIEQDDATREKWTTRRYAEQPPSRIDKARPAARWCAGIDPRNTGFERVASRYWQASEGRNPRSRTARQERSPGEVLPRGGSRLSCGDSR